MMNIPLTAAAGDKAQTSNRMERKPRASNSRRRAAAVAPGQTQKNGSFDDRSARLRISPNGGPKKRADRPCLRIKRFGTRTASGETVLTPAGPLS